MPTNEEGEFELILGNRQLLSVFFIVVVLLGVFFTMGYIVGRNSTPVSGPEVASARKTDSKPLVVDPPTRESAPPSPVEPPPSAPPRETAVQQPPPEPKPEPKKAPEPPKPAPKETAKTKAPEPKKQAPAASEPPSGGQAYLQLVATAKAEADVMVDVLRKKGFKARNAEIPEKPGTFRVLVGPLEDGSTTKIRADLQSAGFPGDKAIKKTF